MDPISHLHHTVARLYEDLACSQDDCFPRKASLPRNQIAIARKSQPQIATRGIGGYVSPSHFHSPVGVQRPNLSLVASEDPQAGAAALHAPDPDGPFIKYVRAIPRNLLS